MNDQKFHIKHIEIYIVIFIIAIATASVAFAYSCSHATSYEPGWYQIELEDNAEVKAYGGDYTFMAYFDGQSKDIMNNRNLYKTYYSASLATHYAYLDDVNTYDSFPSLALLNDHKNEKVTLSEYGYNTLKDAYQKTISSTNYSVFASPLYGFWSNQFNLTTNLQIENDPLNNEENHSYLEKLANYINDRNHVNLEFYDGFEAKLVVSEEYLSFIDEYEISSSLVSLNILRTSYLLDTVGEEMNRKNLDAGFIYTYDGLFALLKNCPDQNYAINTVSDSGTMKVATIAAKKPSIFSSSRAFKLNNDYLPSHYTITKDGVKYYRSYYIDITTGIPHNAVLSSSIYSESFNITESSFINNEVMKCDSLEEIRALFDLKDYHQVKLVIDLNESSHNLYINESIKNYISLSSELDYNLIKI